MPESDNLKESLKIEAVQKQNMLKKQAQALQAEQRRENAKDSKGKPYWETVNEKADSLVDKNFSGFNDWAIGMMDIFHACMDLNKAMFYDPIEFSNLIPYKDELLVPAYDMTIGNLGDKIAKSRLSEKDLPTLRCTADIDEKGYFSSAITKNGHPLSQDQQAHFDAGIVGWARSQGYEPKTLIDPDDPKQERVVRVFEDGHGVKMTHDQFKQLSQDPDTGLNKFLTGQFEMQAGFNPSP